MKKLLYLLGFCLCKLGIHCYVWTHGGYTLYCVVCEKTYVTIGELGTCMHDHLEIAFEGLTFKEVKEKLNG